MGYMLEWELQCHVASELIQSFTCALFDGCKATVNNNTFLNFSSHFFEVQLTILHSTYFFYRGMAFLSHWHCRCRPYCLVLKLRLLILQLKAFNYIFILNTIDIISLCLHFSPQSELREWDVVCSLWYFNIRLTMLGVLLRSCASVFSALPWETRQVRNTLWLMQYSLSVWNWGLSMYAH